MDDAPETPGPSAGISPDQICRSLVRSTTPDTTMAHHRVFLGPDTPTADVAPGRQLVVRGDEAQHAARVKRLEPGERVDALNGLGLHASGTVVQTRKDKRSGEWELVLAVDAVKQLPPERPSLAVLTPAPKGSRLEDMIDQLSQVGAASWSPLLTERTIVEPRTGKLERLERAAMESAKQCGRAWAITIGQSTPLRDVRLGPSVIVADASGTPYSVRPEQTESPTLLVGPEGGWSPNELAHLRQHNCVIASFGPHVMRIETAAPIAAGIVLHATRNFAPAVQPAPENRA